MHRPLEGDCELQIFLFDSDEGRHAFWHSSAHVLGSIMEQRFGAHLTVGPPLKDGSFMGGFYYDCDAGDKTVAPSDFKDIETGINKLIKSAEPFERLVITKEEALEMFKHNPLKCEIINDKVEDGKTCTAYRSGPLVDFCRGPHLPNTKRIVAMAVTASSSAYFKGNAEREAVQRIYGISFPDKKLLKKWLKMREEAAKRDHRALGQQQKLFFFHPLSPGSAFFLPHGTRIYNTLQNFIREQYNVRGFKEVVTPNVFNIDLWKTSGHYQNYKDAMFMFECEKQEFGMKPMNCPGHCLMFKHDLKSFRDLPMRFADFGVLHRNELSGALTGLTRVRRFQQDDAHIFCRRDQIFDEMLGALDFLDYVYSKFGFEYNLCLSTRPEKAMGDMKLWDEAEAQLEKCLETFDRPWTFNHGDGAFYGPKIDIQLKDALGRYHQCATIQLDFQLPINFDLSYKASDGSKERPVIIHRAILGSVERMMAVLIESTAGKWPLWLSPRQVIVVPVALPFLDYAKKVRQQFHDAGFYADVDDSKNQLNKKIREAQLSQYNFILVVGESEQENNTVNVRTREKNERLGEKPTDAFIEELQKLRADFQ
jgi:threonyl-tRNA synthetase